MSLISFTPVTDGSTAAASGVNTPLSTIYNDYNGNITDANVSASAAIAGSKLNLASIANPYKFSVYHNTTQSRATASKIIFNTKDFDTGSNFDAVTNYRFTAPIAGFYFFQAQAYVQSSTDAIRIALYKNGSNYKSGTIAVPPAGPNDGSVTVSALMSLAANDYVEVYYIGTSTRTLNGTTARDTSFEGRFVSAT